MQFDWDSAKDAENIRARGIAFQEAAGVFTDPQRLDWTDTRRDYGEERRKTIGQVGRLCLTVVYTMRGEVCRIITAWPSSRRERSRYGQIHPRHV